MTDFSRPPGDPAALRDVADKALSMGSTVGDGRRSSLNSTGSRAEGALPALRVAAFRDARTSAAQATDTIAVSLTSVAGALGAYATALEDAQKAIQHAKDGWDRAHERWLAARHAGDDALAATYQQQQSTYEKAADDARADLGSARSTAATVLAGEIDTWSPGGAAGPVQAWRNAAAGILPPDITLDDGATDYRRILQEGKTAKDAVANAVKLGLKGWQGWQVASYLRSPSIAAKAEEAFGKAQLAYQQLKGSSPDLGDPAVLKKYLKLEDEVLKRYAKLYPAEALQAQKKFGWTRGLKGETRALQELAAEYPGLTQAEIVGRTGRFAELMAPVRAIGPIVGKVMAPVAIVTGGIDVYQAFTDPDLSRTDRAVKAIGGAASITGGAVTVGIMTGVLAVTPVGMAVIAGAGIVAVGAYAYENREAIWNGIKWTGDKLADGAKAVADGVADVGKGVADGAKKVWHGIFG